MLCLRNGAVRRLPIQENFNVSRVSQRIEFEIRYSNKYVLKFMLLSRGPNLKFDSISQPQPGCSPKYSNNAPRHLPLAWFVGNFFKFHLNVIGRVKASVFYGRIHH